MSNRFTIWLGCAGFFFSLPLFGQKPTEKFAGQTAVAQQILVKFRTPTPALLQGFQQLLDADEIRQVGGATGPHLIHSKSKNLAALLAALTGNSSVVYVVPDYVRTISAVPNDPSFASQWSLHNTGVPNADISAESAWDVSQGSTANVVGVIDTGIDFNHPDLAPNVWSAPAAFTVNISTGSVTCPAGSHGYNFIARTCSPLDDHGHGTHVSGTIGAVGNNSAGVTGINWQTKIMGLKFLDSTGTGSDSDALDAMEFAIQVKNIFAGTANPVNVRVFSNSYGGGGFSQAMLDEINKANSNDILFVAAAGNYGTNNDTTPVYPASYTAPNMIAVAATDSNDALASFSDYGKNSVHLGAPGVSILSTLPNASYGYLSGTSMATPHVSGSAMLVLSACNLTTAALRTTLLSNVDPLSSLASITSSGGRLNVNKAIRACGTQTSGGTSIWSSSTTPSNPWYYDPLPVTLGVKFRSDTAGSITGIRFYKGAGNNGTHIGLLYSNTGTVLAQATFSGETTSGWQQVSFSSAVTIAPNTTYIAALFTKSGYAFTGGYFTGVGVDNAPLHALRSGVDGLNGVYGYGSAPQFPSQSYADSNYWVDVVYSGSSQSQAAVPNVVGFTQSTATTAITNAGLTVGAITTAASATVPAGSVISESPAAGTQVNMGAAITLVVSSGSAVSSSSIWGSSTAPSNPWYNDPSPVTLGVKFRSDTAGSITGIRFYKGTGNNGTHIGLLYSNTGTVLAQATFSGETASGWQQVSFSSAVTIAANTTYVAALFTNSGYAVNGGYFTAGGMDNAPLHALRSGVDGPNGVYGYGSAPQFPSQSYADSNYWVDVVYSGGSQSQVAVPNVVGFTQSAATSAITNAGLTVGTVTVANSATISAGSVISESPAAGTQVNLGSAINLVVSAGSGATSSIWSNSVAPTLAWYNDPSPVTLGVKFRSDTAGTITGIRFYKGAGNTGTHIGLLYSSTGTLLGQVTFSGETASGWQQMNFPAGVQIAANTTYIAALFTTSGFAFNGSYFSTAGVDNTPLHALRSGVDGLNGVYGYGSAPQFPSQSYADANYWVDVLFTSP